MIRSVLRDLASGPIAVQMRRFLVVGALTAGLQLALLWLFVDVAGLNYIIGATIAIEITIICSYVLNNAWTFRASQNTGVSEYFAGLLKTNLVRGTAIPIQLGVLAALVEWGGVMYLIANVIAIVVSGLYRFVLDSQWTWG
ncbi:Putative flippase GtrA (transmembrane translocase of bactoprenol-linked glucose) [Halorubrum xinjiangense]|uniref:Flippase GtrA (Transmembrane translocase of bactoprenol-linked glucose) n=1 Tax=Halorubrum xinjiangense TaxID=261291 RepID=A0A1G7M293_9EURY|nr:GtrA family protein [Halorubrum xinjiangense]SDF55300.1 Putative flippase GtrA (transmembrane translocase of bactoprenol-linked glucose) [Halorubrum xinjiangense]